MPPSARPDSHKTGENRSASMEIDIVRHSALQGTTNLPSPCFPCETYLLTYFSIFQSQ